MNLGSFKKELRSLADPRRAKTLRRFFKTGPGEYGESDKFLGITVPQSRAIAKKYAKLNFSEIKRLLRSPIHEERLIALFILIRNFEKGDKKIQNEIYKFYLRSTKYVNNWDLVDLSAIKIVGHYLLDRPKEILYKLARSKNLWERRIAIISTFEFIKNHKFRDTLEISRILFEDKHDLIHKAIGWMLREVGKKTFDTEYKFLKKYHRKMPRTSLRYAIERFPKRLRERFLQGKV